MNLPQFYKGNGGWSSGYSPKYGGEEGNFSLKKERFIKEWREVGEEKQLMIVAYLCIFNSKKYYNRRYTQQYIRRDILIFESGF